MSSRTPLGLLCLLPLCLACAAAPVVPDAAVPDASALEDGGAPLREALSARAAQFVGAGTVEIFPAGVPEAVPQFPTLVVGVVSAEFTGLLTFAAPDAGPVPTGRTIYPISSVSKLVTGLLAARGVVDGRFTATTPARDLLAADLASLVGDVTLLELATHRAGFDANPRNLDFAGAPDSPATGYTRAQLATCLGAPLCSRARAQRGQYLYSNLGAGLLGLALTDASQQSYEALVNDRLARELGMNDTHTRAFTDATRLTSGVRLDGVAVPAATMGVLAPAGELLSTGDDLLLLLQALVQPPPALAPTVALASASVPPGDFIAWSIDVMSRDGLSLRAKSGEQAGFSSQVMWSPELQAGAFALGNRGMSSRTLANLLIEVHVLIRDARR